MVNYRVSKEGKVYSLLSNRSLTPTINNKTGYVSVMLQGKRHYLHRLVATEYLDNPLSLTDVNHKDGNKVNCNVDNLEWVSHRDNMKHAVRTGLLTPPTFTVAYQGHSDDIGYYFPSLKNTKGSFDSSAICKCIKGVHKTHKGLVWSKFSKERK